jgi:glutaminase
MFTCGMYDYAGHWAYDVGIPAKSGVGGGIVGVINRQLGIGSYSPRLDGKGNSVRGVASFEMLADDFGLHAFDCTNVGSTFISSLIR